ncbi:S-adenosyl-L-methionine-dependent methyltransferase [Limtongia smithiae]|uniref:S-adenosyl-L-methionine-dependent methyltransferase n=1 Tax=Limtongia smithiae TaxID=1125753 RepID=UPI0034CD2C14
MPPGASPSAASLSAASVSGASHASRDVPYPFADTDADFERIEFFSVVTSQILGGRFLPSVDHLENRKVEILDCCCGSGAWTTDIACVMPLAHVVGFDIRATRVEHHVPNAEFLVADVNEPLPFDDDTFDIVHSRTVCLAVTNWDDYLRELKRVLKPTGYIHLIEPVIQPISQQDLPLMYDLLIASRFGGTGLNIYAGTGVVDAARVAGLHVCQAQSFPFQLGTLGADSDADRIGSMMLSCMQDSMRALVDELGERAAISPEARRPYYEEVDRYLSEPNREWGIVEYVVACKDSSLQADPSVAVARNGA